MYARFAAIMLVACPPVLLAQDRPAIDSATLFPEIERRVAADMQAQHIPGYALAVVANGRVLYARGFGVANIDNNTPMTPGTLLRLGSISKPVTALAVIAEARARGISLEAPIGKYLTTLDPSVGRVTLHQLLTHSAGVREVVTATPIVDRPDERQLVAQLREWTDTMFFGTPGEIVSYSNPGFALAGAFIEAVSGKRFADIVAEHVWRPLGVTEATWSSAAAVKGTYADGYLAESGGGVRVVRPIKTDARYLPPTMLWASAADIARLEIALMDHGRIDGRQALDSATVDLAVAPHVLKPGASDEWYGYGFDLDERPRGRLVAKSGHIEGYEAVMYMMPSLGIGFITMSNLYNQLPRSSGAVLATAVTGRAGRPVAATSPETWNARELVGHYVNGTWAFDVRDSAGVVVFHGPASPTSAIAVDRRIVPTTANHFLLAPLDGAAQGSTPGVVVRDASGRAKYLYFGDRAARREAR